MTLRAAFACFALACTLPGAAAAATLRWSSQGDAGTMDPHAYNEGLNNSIKEIHYESLVRRGKDMSFQPSLAESWSSPAPNEWIFNLRRGVRFHDGSPFTADDVVFSIARAREGRAFRIYTTLVGEARRIDDHTVAFRTPKPNPAMLESLLGLSIMSKAWCEKHNVVRPQNFMEKQETHAVRNANGTGAYRLVSWEPSVRMVHERNPDWWGVAAGLFEGNVERLEYRPIANASTRMAALRSGVIDFVLDPAVQDLLALGKDADIRVWRGEENRVLFFALDQDREELLYSDVKGRNPFKDRRVRAAMYQAIDIAALKTHVMRGMAAPSAIVLPDPALAGLTPSSVQRPAPDPAAARRLLAEAGYPDGFGFTLHCTNDRYVNDERICTAVAAMWARAGLRVRVETMSKVHYNPRGSKRDLSAGIMGWGGGHTDPIFWLKPVIQGPRPDGSGGWNLGNVRNAELDALIDRIEVEMDPAVRTGLIGRAVRLIHDEVLVIPLHKQVTPWASRRNVSVVHMPNNWLVPTWVKMGSD
jgi:peptide/nickel transport system substrate-binding protein